MRLRFYFVIALLLYTMPAVFAQHGKNINIIIKPTFKGQALIFDNYYYLPSGDSISFETFKCYISNIKFYNERELTMQDKDGYHLIDASEGKMVITLRNMEEHFSNIRFDIGIDSLTNVSGARGGDLDPTKGMYWTWQSGYINVKLEGYSNLCATRKHKFQLHLGGYKNETYALQHISLATRELPTILINIPIDQFIGNIDLAKHSEIMVPGKEAVNIAQQLANVIEIAP